ncbi:unnamed protein product [Caenorhabditis angaria]|uniref:Uncharacterized protein n=1 Tax=Caenorhabditis angaria TaxID=860376 RepID=A0A9P1IKW6_9PELO|nr:unnamed protein product [Caenorhabditis angaria]
MSKERECRNPRKTFPKEIGKETEQKLLKNLNYDIWRLSEDSELMLKISSTQIISVNLLKRLAPMMKSNKSDCMKYLKIDAQNIFVISQFFETTSRNIAGFYGICVYLIISNIAIIVLVVFLSDRPLRKLYKKDVRNSVLLVKNPKDKFKA